jgi:RimJ/RimL family protein N-acetyltransferase
MEQPFVPVDFEVPEPLVARSFRLEPLGPVHNDRDHEAWMSSIDHIQSTPGFEDWPWPTPMSLEANLQDLVDHAEDFEQRRGFTYSIVDGDEVVGCLYMYPARHEAHDVEVRSWVREDRAPLDAVVWRAVSAWVADSWPFESPLYAPRQSTSMPLGLVMQLDYPDPELRSDLVRLRKWSYDDLACIEEAARTDPTIPQGTTVPSDFTEARGRAFIERQWGRQTSGQGLSLAIADAKTDEAMGLVFLGLGRIKGHCDLGYWLIPSARRQGFASEAIDLVSRWVLTATDVHRLVAQVEPGNAASLAVLRRCGFTEEGLLRSWLWIDDELFDAIQFSLLRSDLDAS